MSHRQQTERSSEHTIMYGMTARIYISLLTQASHQADTKLTIQSFCLKHGYGRHKFLAKIAKLMSVYCQIDVSLVYRMCLLEREMSHSSSICELSELHDVSILKVLLRMENGHMQNQQGNNDVEVKRTSHHQKLQKSVSFKE